LAREQGSGFPQAGSKSVVSEEGDVQLVRYREAQHL